MHRNGEHYPDPTFDEVYRNICRDTQMIENSEKYMSWVYIASPYRGNITRNTENARKYAAFAVRQNKVPLCPHIYFTQFLDDSNECERNHGLNLALQMLKRCKEMWVFGETISSGMKNEIRMAQRWNIPIKYFNKNCEAIKQ